MTKVKYDGFKYYAMVEYRPEWIPFYDSQQGNAIKAFGKIEQEIEVSEDSVYLQNCGPKCTGAYPDKNCGNCGGRGLGATFGWRFMHDLNLD